MHYFWKKKLALIWCEAACHHKEVFESRFKHILRRFIWKIMFSFPYKDDEDDVGGTLRGGGLT
ncbi:unnamed protein product, partial [Vitis vinifera]|uniref:Uncharacterized protein n=1 Tax=Vitis vinifera TaxID=29760 RepID=D7TJE9_VITVI